MDYLFFRLPIIDSLLLVINSSGLHDYIDDLNCMVIGKRNVGVAGDMLDKNEISYMLISPGFH